MLIEKQKFILSYLMHNHFPQITIHLTLLFKIKVYQKKVKKSTFQPKDRLDSLKMFRYSFAYFR